MKNYLFQYKKELENFIKIDNVYFYVSDSEWSLTILQFCDKYNITIPRFCYHDALSISGNCRMCCVELDTSPKPVIACGTNLFKGISIKTNTPMVKKARENVLEFLLINHPLDCPICDQAGECDLQDQSYVFGSDRGRFEEVKRGVSDKNFGPFVKAIMTRCIHCTRCVRFMDEIAKEPLLGVMGRGKAAEISLYSFSLISHELSGNLVDVCPVGALTSKPYAFTARPWELKVTETIDIMDSLCASVRVDTKGNKVVRILPRTNFQLNDFWITDKIRFVYDAFEFDRLVFPMLKNLNTNLYVISSWSAATRVISAKLISSSKKMFLSGDAIDVTSGYLFNLLADLTNSSIAKASPHCDFLSSFTSFKLLKQFTYSFLVYSIDLKIHNPIVYSKLLNFKKHSILYIGLNKPSNSSFVHPGISNLSFLQLSYGKNPFSMLLSSSGAMSFWSCIGSSCVSAILSVFNKFIKVESNFVASSASELTDCLGGSGLLNGAIHKVYSVNDFFYLLNFNTYIKFLVSQSSFLVYQGHSASHNAMLANVLLPCSLFVEDEFVYMNLYGQLQTTRRCVVAPVSVKNSVNILLDLLASINYIVNTSDLFWLFSGFGFSFVTHFECSLIYKNGSTSSFLSIVEHKMVYDYYLTDLLTASSVNLSRMRILKNQCKKYVNFDL